MATKTNFSLKAFVLFGLSLSALTVPRVAQAKPEAMTVLVRLQERVPKAWHKVILDSAYKAVIAQPRYSWLQPPEISIEETRDLLGCGDWSPDCVAQIGKSLGAKYLLYVEVMSPFQQPPILTLFQINVDKPEQTLSQSVRLPDAALRGQMALQHFVKGVINNASPSLVLVDDEKHLSGGLVAVSADGFGDATIELDGQAMLGSPAVFNPKLSSGRHRLTVRKPGFQSLQQDVLVKAGRPFAVALHMKPGAGSGIGTATLATTNGLAQHKANQAQQGDDWKSTLSLGSFAVAGLSGIAGLGLYAVYWTTASSLADAATQTDNLGRVDKINQASYQQGERLSQATYWTAMASGAVAIISTVVGAFLLVTAD